MNSATYRAKRAMLRIFFCAAGVLLLAGSLAAQIASGGLTGTVKDSEGAIVRNAQVALTNVATGVTQRTQTTSTGVYVFNSVPPGVYTLHISMSGFQEFTSRGIRINIQSIPEVNATLRPGEVSQQVTVTAGIPFLQTQDAGVGQTISGEEINEMPLLSRDWTSLAQLSPGVTTTPGGKPNDPDSQTSGFVVQGIQDSQNDIRLNGIDDNQEMWTQGAVIVPPPRCNSRVQAAGE